MIGKLKGFIDEIEFGFIILDVAGVGYNVYVSAQVVHQVSLGQKATLEIEMVVREDQITLYGFLNKEERAWFRLLQGVQGVGAKVALAVLGVMSISSLRDAILCGDSKMIQSVPGIGPKLATRIVNEVKNSNALNKMLMMPISSDAGDVGESGGVAAATSHDGMVLDATNALVSLGFERIAAYKVVSEAALSSSDMSLESLIRLSLGKMGSKAY